MTQIGLVGRFRFEFSDFQDKIVGIDGHNLAYGLDLDNFWLEYR